ncbi:MAG TPA: GtrA family protein [Candidatus Paceibacterota bacterium]|nr:GtrA family protein [Candidatus Paceibacterota bacterium]
MQMRQFGFNKESLWALMVSLAIGAPTYLIDVSVIYFSIHRLHLHYPHAVAAGFIVGALFNYTMNRMFVYTHSKQPHAQAITYYFAIAFIWLWFTIGATVFLVDRFHLELYIARSIVGLFVGIAGFAVSSLITFKIPTRR